ncbi:nose resistant to fluoxetine protein 6 [Trichonephila inaurata madagascariensis]|uniref:Nose resistant to fluoxetine protein 6 n=1 Tax=Trichonephila inaurata madagascariensis TaxID=2747483 RepID=A0A8X7CGS3_9ARAC|nr:nose resistant to fluoxetine protein 6 [Trichonephila inaurata madagascariensis]
MKRSIVYFVLCLSTVYSDANFNGLDASPASKSDFSSSFWKEYFEKVYRNVTGAAEGGVFAKEKHEFLTEAQSKCLKDVKYIFRHLKSKWVIQMLDAYGKVPSGTLRGNFLWIGKYEECVDVHVDADRNDSRSEIDGIYCVATWNVKLPNNFNLPLQQLPVKTGLCLPESCSSLDIKQDIRHLVSLLRSLPFLGEYGEFLNFHSMTCKETFPRLSVPALIFLYILGAYFSFIIAGSCITLCEYIRSSCTSSSKCAKEQSSAFTDFVSEEGDAHFIDGESFTELLITKKSCSLLSNGAFQRCFKASSVFLRCFCLFSNTAKILDTSTTANTFSCIHGIRFFSMAWVILGHTYIHNTNIIGNYMDLLHSIDNLPFQTVTQGTFSVDSFFLISGFLLCYLFLEESDKRNGKINLFVLCLHRFVRLTPVYMLLIAFNTLVFKYTGSGPFWGDDSDIGSCKQYWWWNLLYINNFLPLESMCITWTWYLADDMQFFLVGIILMSILGRWPVVGLTIGITLLFGSWIVTWCISYYYDLVPLFVGITTATDYETYKNRLVLAWNLIYSKPYCRCGPYIIGILLAYIMYQNRNKNWNMKLWLKCLGWCCGSFCSLSVVFGMYHVQENATLFHFYSAFSRSAFSLGVAWVIFCCLSGNGGNVVFRLFDHLLHDCPCNQRNI